MLTIIFSEVGVRKEIFAESYPSNPIMRPLYQRPSVCLNLHFDPSSKSFLFGSSSFAGLTAAALLFRPWRTMSASCNNRARFNWKSPSSASLIAPTSSSCTLTWIPMDEDHAFHGQRWDLCLQLAIIKSIAKRVIYTMDWWSSFPRNLGSDFGEEKLPRGGRD